MKETKLAAIMRDRDITPRELAIKTELHISTIYRMMHSKDAGYVYTWLKVAKALNVSVESICPENGTDRVQ